jgi:predicted DNA-binding antitoxin AbrB/MazE fold protein
MMIVLTAIYENGQMILDQSLPSNLEGKKFQIFIKELNIGDKKRRQSGSAKGQIWMAENFDEPLEEFEDYLP